MGDGNVPPVGLSNNSIRNSDPAAGADPNRYAHIINWINIIEGLQLTELPPTFPLLDPSGVEYDGWTYHWNAESQQGRWVGHSFENTRGGNGDPNIEAPHNPSASVAAQESPDEVSSITCALHTDPYCLRCCSVNPAYHLRCFEICFKYHGRQ